MYNDTLPTHFIQALCQRTLLKHFIQALYQSTLHKHFIKALYTSTLSKHFIQALYQGITKGTTKCIKTRYQDQVLRQGNATRYYDKIGISKSILEIPLKVLQMY